MKIGKELRMSRRSLTVGVWIGWITVVGLLITACGGVATKEEGASGEEGGPVKIGAPYPLSGAWAENGQNNVQGMQLAIDEINSNGGIEALDGAQLELAEVDTSSDDPSQAQSVTTRLIRDERVSALVGSYLSSLTLTSSTAAEEEGAPMLTQSFVDELTDRGYSTIFQLPPKSSTFGTESVNLYAQIAQEQGRPVQTSAVVTSNDAATKAQAETVQTQAEGRNIEVGAFAEYPPGIEDASAVVNQVQSAEPDVIFAGGPVGDITLIIQGLRDRGIEAPIVGTGGTGFLVKGLAEGLGQEVDGLLSLSAWNEDMEVEGGEAIREASEAYKQTYGEPFMPQEAGESYVAVYLIKEASEQSQSSDPAAIRDMLAQMSVDSGPQAAMPPGRIAFDDTGMNEYATPIMIQWQDQVPKTVWPEEMAAADVRLP
jgi:branched-chain amino acid transport system substrate-binding protein